MLITRSCCIDCQGTFNVLRPEDLRHTLGLFWRSECKLIENIFGILKIFVSWHAKHEATYIVNTKTYETNVYWVRATQRASIVEPHVLLNCSQQVTAKCTINFDVPSQILQANNFGAPLSQFPPVFRGVHGPPGPPAPPAITSLLTVGGNIVNDGN